MTTQPKVINWDIVMQWLEDGYALYSIAPWYGLTRDRMGRRARFELPDDTYRRFKRLVMENRISYVTCGTDGGYNKHLRNKEPTCDACRAAHREMIQEYRTGRRGNCQSTKSTREATSNGTGRRSGRSKGSTKKGPSD